MPLYPASPAAAAAGGDGDASMSLDDSAVTMGTGTGAGPDEHSSPLPPSLSDRLSPGFGFGGGGRRRSRGGVGGEDVPPPPESTFAGTGTTTWDANGARRSLRSASIELGRRGLRLAARWAAEQLVGLPPPRPAAEATAAAADGGGPGADTASGNADDDGGAAMDDLELYAKSLLDLGEFRRAASVLSGPPGGRVVVPPQQGGGPDGVADAASCAAAAAAGGSGGHGDLATGPPLTDLSPFGVYLRAYCLYMAGERRKEEEIVELRDPLDRTTIRNSSLTQLAAELFEPYVAGTLDAFGLYIYGVVLKALRATNMLSSSSETDKSPASVLGLHRDDNIDGSPSAHAVLIECLLLYPYNWSAWLDLSELCIDDPSIHPDVEDKLRPISFHWMYHFFCVHVFLENQANENAMAVIERLVNGNGTDDDDDEDSALRHHPDGMFVRSPYLQSQLAVAHYNLRDFDEAEGHFVALSERDPERLDQMDVYSNILYVKEDRVGLSRLAHRAVRVDKYRPETCCIVGNYYSLRGQHERAVTYFQRALKLDGTYLSAWTLMGHEYVEMKNTAAAVEAYRRAVDINARDYRAWYGLGQTYEILDMLLYALFYYRRAATLRPYDARMWSAMGGCYLGLGRREDAVRAYERAVSNHDAEGIATRKLASLYSEDGDSEGAARCYLRHLELRFRSQGGADRGGGGSASGGPGGVSDPPSIETIVNLVEVDAAEAEALLYLGYYHRDNGEYETAAACCSRLLEYPGPEKEEGKALLREIRSRMDRRGGGDGGGSVRGGSRRRTTGSGRFGGTTSAGATPGSARGDDSMDFSRVAPESSFEFSP